MKLLKLQKSFKIFTNLTFALFILGIIAIGSSIGSFIEQDEPISFYEQNYATPIYGFIDKNFIFTFGLDHVYRTWWFLTLLLFLAISLISCTISRQFPLFLTSKDYFFKKKETSLLTLPFSVKLKNIYYLKETILLKIQKMNFYIYQYGDLIYGYKGLIGRISPILVHFSLLIILGGASIGAFKNFKVQEVLPKGEIFHVQNPINVGWLTNLPTISTRVNDFWVEYENNRIHQFYSNLSLLDNSGNEIRQQTISVNNPLRYQDIDFYQSDWNLLGIRVKNTTENKIYEFPVFSLNQKSKSWVTWVKTENGTKILVFDQLQNNFLLYDESGKFLETKNLNEEIGPNLKVIDLLPSTGLLIKYDPSIKLIYFGFGLLMITSSLSYLPYTQLWILNKKEYSWIGSSTNRGKIQLEIEFENFIRSLENTLTKNIFLTSKTNKNEEQM
jgi:cytochrome c biogenesis protein